ncbi:hypothetical protein VTK73DRAFT_145 [Phialemonium thermophilum]|uniref:Uncharacterized protein n=1 Tax=Phialemonium thermophilum TaxID=223376 RepID=A0ABR3XFR4_9PEZI
MAGRYTAEDLLFLRQSPLCVKPPGLPPPEEWMGPPPETSRAQNRVSGEKSKGNDAITFGRFANEKTGLRINSHPDDMILGPPRTSFASATTRLGETERAPQDSEVRERLDKFNYRARMQDSDQTHDHTRDGRTNAYRRRGDTDQDSDGWSTVKPRKSFGHDGAERFHGRISGDRFNVRDDRRPRERDDRDNGERRTKNFSGQFSRDKDGDETEGHRRNGLSKGRSESWSKDNNDAPPISQRERIDRAKNWRERAPEDKVGERKFGDRTGDRGYDRRWDRDREQRVEKEPEWLDEPAENKSQTHTEEDFKKFMEAMKAGSGRGAKPTDDKPALTKEDKPSTDTAFVLEQKVVSAPAIEVGQDKFFAAYSSASLETPGPKPDAIKEASKPKAAKPSRFTSFFSAVEESRGKTEPPTPAAAVTSHSLSGPSPQQSDAEKEAFQVLLQKLQRSGPPQNASSVPGYKDQLAAQAAPLSKAGATSPEPFQPYGTDQREDPRLRANAPPIQDILSPRSVVPPTQLHNIQRPEPGFADFFGQQGQPQQGGPNRVDQAPSTTNDNAEFLMRLMQSARNSAEPPRTEQLLMRMPQPTKQVALPVISDREPEFQRERSVSQQRQMRPQGPPGFLDEQFHHAEGDGRPQPTQILQRPPPPPGLDHTSHLPPFPLTPGGQMPPAQRPMIPPPGFINNARNAPVPNMFPSFPAGHFPSPDAMPGPPTGQPGPRPMQPPPGFYGGPPPPGFIPQLPGMNTFQQGPDALGFRSPFDGRGMPPPGSGAPFRRP